MLKIIVKLAKIKILSSSLVVTSSDINSGILIYQNKVKKRSFTWAQTEKTDTTDLSETCLKQIR